MTRAELLADGIAGSAIDRRLRAGRLHTFLPGTYLVGHYALTADRVWWSALASGGAQARLCGRSWLEVLELLDARPGRVTVAIPRSCETRVVTSPQRWNRAAIEVHFTRPRGAPLDAPVHRDPRFGLPGIDVHRALLQLAGDPTAGPDDFRRALREAEFRRLITDRALRAELGSGRAGSGVLREVLDRRALGAMAVRNGLEDEGVELFLSLGMPQPETNVWVQTPQGGVNVDYWWRLLGLVIEFDGRGEHDSIGGQMRDHQKDAKLRSAGIDVMHFDWWQATHARHQIADALIGAGYLRAAA